MPDATICAICGGAYAPSGHWHSDWCDWCALLNFADSQELRLREELAPARLSLEAYVSSAHRLPPRQCAAMARLHARWEAEALRRQAGEEDEA